MANEVASLGVKVDASGIESGTKALDALAQQGPKVEQAMAGVEGAAVKTGKSLKTMGDGSAKGLDEIGRSAPRAAESLGRVAKSAEDATRALAGINASVASLGQVTTVAGQSARGIAGFSASLQASQKSLTDMQAQVRATSTVVAQLSTALTATVPAAQAAAKAQADAAKSAVDMSAAFKSASDQFRAYSTVAVSASDAGQKAAKSMDTTATAARALTSAMAMVGVGFGAQELITLADGYGKVTAQLRLATNGASDYAAAMESVRRISRSAQQGLGEVGTLYARIANGTAELGISQRRLSEITEVVALSLRASNATASEASSAMLQLSQAFASGVLRGEEFNAVNEAATRLMKALADGIGQPVGALRKMAEEGKLTAQVLATALPKALEEVRIEAAKMQTIGGSFTVLKNSMMEFFGTTAQSSGAVSGITTSVELLADNLNLLTAAAIGFGATKLSQFMVTAGAAATKNATDTIAYVAALNQQRAAAIAAAEAEAAVSAARVAGLSALQAKLVAERQAALTEASAATSTAARTQALMAASVAELNLTRTSAQLTTATVAQTAAQTALTAAVTATSTAATVASRALTLVGGPIGLITTALGLGVTAWAAWGSSAESASAQAKNAIVSGHQDIVSRLDEQIRKLSQRAGLLAIGNVAAARDEDPAAQELGRLNSRIQEMRAQGASLSGPDQIVLIELQRQYENLNSSLEKRKGLQEQINGLGVQDRLNALEMKKGGFSKDWLEELKTRQDALKAGIITAKEYAAAVNEMNKRRYESTAEGKEAAKLARAGKAGAGRIAKADLSSDLADIQIQYRMLTTASGNAERLLDAQRAAGLVSEREYYAQKRKFVEDNAALQIRELEDENKRYAQQAATGADKINNEKKIAQNTAKMAEIRAKADTDIKISTLQQEEANRQLEASYKALEQSMAGYLKTSADRYQRELQGMGLGNQWRDQNAAANQINDRYESQRNDLRNNRERLELEKKWNSDLEEQYQRRLEIINDANQKALGLDADYWRRRLQMQQDWTVGASEALTNYLNDANNTAALTEKAFTNGISGMEDALVSFVTTGKLSFSQLANSIIADITRIIIKQQLAAAIGGAGGSNWLGGLVGGLFGTSGTAAVANVLPGNPLDNLLNLTGNFVANAKGGVYDSPSLSMYSNQVHSTPKVFAFAKGAGVFAEAGPEAIMPLTRNSAGVLGVRAMRDTAGGDGAGNSRRAAAPININIPVAGQVDRRTKDQLAFRASQELRRVQRFS
ncbi:phage tail tape measure protein, lambda family [Delftia acidovorans SPH-1]|uniref:Phage tail tape measure protein, lambda family n=1 Tax=Delftia acidovorans (strain DSM 14801 / SPH-1) TaxID=398578 RepID=A9C0E9_DELAS|nr:phage tail tape measure protein [Delftia acidovorans]ABX36715.1 phage tail tape measure protein, lambda family [Delftia acidovorans SPH-1]QPS74035.1 phage tail tape measure protein [Delftia acidovorans]